MSVRINGESVSKYLDLTQEFNAQVSSYVLALSDKNKMIDMSSTSAMTLSVPTNATPFPIGTQIHILQANSGQITVQPLISGTTTINATPGLKLRAQWSSATLIKRSTESWVLIGDLSA